MFSACPGQVLSVDGSGSFPSIQARSWLTPQILSANQQDTIVMTLPWPLAQRFASLNEVNVGHLRIWTVYIDILSPLVAAINAPANIDVMVFARFKNVHLYFPFQVSSLSNSQKVNPGKQEDRKEPQRTLRLPGHTDALRRMVKQSSTGDIKLSSYKAKRKVVRISKASQDPVSEAANPSTPGALSTLGTMTSAIGSVGDFVEEAATTLQPVLSLASDFLGFLDKPEIQDPVTRVYQTAEANMVQADRPDQALPLTLYQTSYLNIDHSVLPGGKNWTFADIALTPALMGQFKFTPTAGTVTFPFIGNGTPLALCIGLHKWWRSSVRWQVKFFCSAFISARILFVLSPAGLAVADTIANNLSRVVDVKGDTTCTFTLPYFNEYDYLPGGVNPNADSAYTITASVLNQIVTNDVTITPSIDMVIFSSAGPDCQFSGPVSDGFQMWYAYPNNIVAPTPRRRTPLRASDFDKMEKQSNVQMDFKKEFEPFVMDCEYLTESHHTTSETSLYVTDVMKRYQLAVTSSLGEVSGTLPSEYKPDPSTLGYFLSRCFLFARGGIKYKLVEQTAKTLSINWGPRASGWTGEPGGAACFVTKGLDAEEFSVAVPYMDQQPYISTVIPSFCLPLVPITLHSGGQHFDNYQFYVAVRDDYQLGFLIPPDIYI
jgi:hypothetical protein